MIWQLLAIVVAVGVMASPDLLGLPDAVADAFHVLGPMAVSVGAMAASKVLRGLRRLHLLLGPAIAAAPLLLDGGAVATAIGLAGGAVLVLLAIPGGSDPRPIGGGWRALVTPSKSISAEDGDRS